VSRSRRLLSGAVLIALSAAALAALGAAHTPAAVVTAAATCPRPQQPPTQKLITRPRWLSSVLVTEYFPAPERWFDGRLVSAPGLPGRHRIDWLYSSRGLAMQGEGIGLDGRFYHFAGPYSQAWRTGSGGVTVPCRRAPGYWTAGSPAWIGPTRLNAAGAVTYPLAAGGWSNGALAASVDTAARLTFAAGASLPLTYWRDVAVDPHLIPYGSHVFVPAYCDTPGHGWFTASDTGGAIIGRHLDVFRAPPSTPWASSVLRGQTVFVVPPGFTRPPVATCR
jgi:3D (Asp-Asp-Asp) domain-containing protein